MMIVVMPTCDRYAPVAGMSLALLERHWADHPPVHVLHHAIAPPVPTGARVTLHDCGPVDAGWLGPVVRFLDGQGDELVLLLLDDYGMCGPPGREIFSTAERLFEADRRVGMFALPWYPGRTRTPRDDWSGLVTLGAAPILLQAAIWRRSCFLELARDLDPRTSAHGFERLATQRAKGCGIEIMASEMAAPRYIGGHFIDAFDKADWPLPYHNLIHAGRLDRRHAGFLRDAGFDLPAQGLGDTIERITRATGSRLANWAGAVSGRDCGCERRREAMNRMVPYR